MGRGGNMDERPKDAASLREWIRTWLDVDLPTRAVIEGHSSPFEYVEWSFFEDHRFAGERGCRRPGVARPADAVVWANRGGGKTFLGALATVLDLVFKPGIDVRVLAGSLEQAQRMYAHLRRFLEREELRELIEGRATEKKLRLTNGSCVELLAQSQSSVRGTRVQRLRCDEVELFEPEVWEAAQLTTRSKQCGETWVRGSIECLSTMHIPHGLMHRLIAETQEGKRRLFRWGVVDVLERCKDEEHRCEESGVRCPLWEECGGRAKGEASGGGSGERRYGHVTIDDAIGMKKRVAESTWASEMLCLRPRRDDAVLPEFNASRHVVERLPWDGPPAEWPVSAWVGGMDFGYRAPAAVLWGVVDAEGRLWIVDERVKSHVTVAEHARAIHASSWPVPAWIAADPAGNGRNEQTGISSVAVLRQSKLTVRTLRLPTARGLELLRARLSPASGAPRLLVHARCRVLIESLERYHYPEGRPESMEPVKDGPDHAVDALRYLVQNLDGPRGTRVSKYA